MVRNYLTFDFGESYFRSISVVDLVIEAGEVMASPTTVVDLTGDEPEVLRVGAGDPSRFA